MPTPMAFLYAKLLHKPILFSPRGALSPWALAQRKAVKKMWFYLFIRPFVNEIIWHTTSELEKQEIQNLISSAKTW